MGPAEVENSGADERILDEERIEERSSVHDEVTKENVATARHIACQLPQTVVADVDDTVVSVVDAVVAIIDAVVSDLFKRLPHQSSYPDADVGGQTVHQTKPSDEFELLDVELLNQFYSVSNQTNTRQTEAVLRYVLLLK